MPTLFTKILDFKNKRYKQNIKKHPYPTKQKFHLGSFKDAINGFLWTLKTQPNFGVELIATILLLYGVLVLYYINLPLSKIEILILFLTSFIVLVLELLNTAVEALSDEVANGMYKDFIRIAKDTSAASVLVASFFWISLIFILFIPKIIDIIFLYFLV